MRKYIEKYIYIYYTGNIFFSFLHKALTVAIKNIQILLRGQNKMQ